MCFICGAARCGIEESPPSGVTPIQWLLLTTLEVNNFNEAICRIRWYTYRWLIERYHYVLKSGCRIEQLQLKNAERIKKALATYTKSCLHTILKGLVGVGGSPKGYRFA